MLEKPSPENVGRSLPDQQQVKGRRILLLLLAIFALPVLLVIGMYKVEWRPPSGSSYGQLQQPPKPLRLPEVPDANGVEFTAKHWREKWSLLTIGSQGCQADCLERVRLMRQVHVALNKEIGRVQRVLLLPSGAPDEDIRTLRENYPDLHVLVGAGAADLANQFDASGEAAGGAGRVYLVDPLGHWMMSYPRDFDPKGLLTDLQRLLKYSWVG